MRSLSRKATFHRFAARLACLVVIGIQTTIAAPRAPAQARNGFDGKPIAASPEATADCEATGFLIGITEQQTDRLIGLQYSCVKATSTQHWDADSRVQRLGPGDLRHGASTTKSCPADWYLVGLEAITGSYSADTHGMAKPTPPRMIADLALICRDRQGNTLPFSRHHLTQADDNDLRRISWDGIGGPRSCRAGYGAVKISFSYDGRPGIDPANAFYDAALTCKRLPIQVAPMASHRP